MGMSFWPAGMPREVTLAAFRLAFESLGYAVCNSSEVEAGFEKIAVFANSGTPTHAARTLESGTWSSKLGQIDDISHDLRSVEGATYGIATLFLRRSLAKLAS
jgi:hypothetical protein